MKKLMLLLVSVFVLTLQNNAQTVTDIDGNVYHTVSIGTQTWLKENLRTTHFNDGTLIPNVISDSVWFNTNLPSMCYYDNNPDTYSSVYGGLYNFYVITDSKNVCPVGWHVPTNDDFIVLKNIAGSYSNAGLKIKEAGTSHWETETGSTNETGFTALPAGQREETGEYINLGTATGFLLPLVYDNIDHQYKSRVWVLGDGINDFGLMDIHLKDGWSIRCMKTTNNGINENEEIRDIKTYPNPVTDKVTIELAKSIKNGSISIYNHQGQLLYNQTVESMKIDINTSNLVNGLYFIKIDGLEGSATREFVKQ